MPKAKPYQVIPFPILADDPLADAHVAVAAWVEEAVTYKAANNHHYQDLELKSFPTGQVLLAGTPSETRRFVVAAIHQARYWDELRERVRQGAPTESERDHPHHLPGWSESWDRRRQVNTSIQALMRRTLPFEEADFLLMLAWFNAEQRLSKWSDPVAPVVRALGRFAATKPLSADLIAALGPFAAKLRTSFDKEIKRLATPVEQLILGDPSSTPPEIAETEPATVLPPPRPAPAGDPRVLVALKSYLGIPSGPEESAGATTTLIGPDQFPLRSDSPLTHEHEAITALISSPYGLGYQAEQQRFSSHVAELCQPRDMAMIALLALAAAERHVHGVTGSFPAASESPERYLARCQSMNAPELLFKEPFTADRAGLFDRLLYLATQSHFSNLHSKRLRDLIERLEAVASEAPLTEGERFVVLLFRATLVTGPPLGKVDEMIARATRLIGDEMNFFLVPGEVWTDVVNADLTALAPARRDTWVGLLKHALTATSTRPSAKWLAAGRKLLDEVGQGEVHQAFVRWLPLVARGRVVPGMGRSFHDIRGAGDSMNDENATILKGLLWLAPTLPDPGPLNRAITSVALSAYKKVPGVGPRAVKVGNAAVYALSELKSIEAVGQLAILKVRVKFGSAQKEIEKAFATTAAALGLPADQIEELGVPSYGLEDVGRRVEMLGDYKAELVVSGTDASLTWFDPKGKALKSVPAKVKADHKDDLKDLQQGVKDIAALLPAQRDRIDGLFLLQRSWPVEDWLARYGNHPLVGTIARRLIWRVDGVAASWVDGTPTDLGGQPIVPGPESQVTTWHPVDCPIDEVLAWRNRLEALGVTQPFKQAHREIYLLTDAERRTATYSNRFAAHVIRQHQFNALCSARGWKNTLRLMVDDDFPPASRILPQWGLRAEFWVEGIGDDYGGDTNETGTYLRLATDQVRFYRVEAATNRAHAGGGGYESSAAGPGTDNINDPLPIDQIPPLVFSEIMRDVDLFVGVASVGNDPTWQDGGPDGRYQTYWQRYSFGELSGTATTRKEVLERLVPRLKIAGRCTLDGRFLKVQGHKRTYKIHLGSGNILMEPNDQYLCIVADSRAKSAPGDLFLPFEGDNMLSIILSKALMLADDDKIKDSTILSQINR